MFIDWPQAIYLFLLFGGVALSVIKHDQPREGRYDGNLAIITGVLMIGLLYWGGFFS